MQNYNINIYNIYKTINSFKWFTHTDMNKNDGKTVHKEVPSHLTRLRIPQVPTSEGKDSNIDFEDEKVIEWSDID